MKAEKAVSDVDDTAPAIRRIHRAVVRDMLAVREVGPLLLVALGAMLVGAMVQFDEGLRADIPVPGLLPYLPWAFYLGAAVLFCRCAAVSLLPMLAAFLLMILAMAAQAAGLLPAWAAGGYLVFGGVCLAAMIFNQLSLR